jgi:phosphoglucosamine mutase
MAQQLFGTDGVRGKAGEFPLDPPTVARLGAALVRAMPPAGRPLRFVIGRDTRESGEWIERELARGIHSAGARDHLGRRHPDARRRLHHAGDGLRRGPRDLGIPQPVRGQRHQGVLGPWREVHRGARAAGRGDYRGRSWQVDAAADATPDIADVVDAYIAHARLALPEPQRLGRMRIAIDAANGATTTVAPKLFTDLGFDVHLLGNAPDGRNINLRLRLHASRPAGRDRRRDGCRMGVAFDGDGDRAIFVDADGPSWTATPCCSCAHGTCRPTAADGQRRRRHRDEQHRPRDRAARERDRAGALRRSATST